MTQSASSAAGRPPRIMLMMNGVFKVLLRSPLHGLMSQNLMLITFTGRKSGKQFTTPVSRIDRDGKYSFFTGTGWWRNLQGGAPVTLTVAGKAIRGTPEVITDPAVILKETRAFLDRHGYQNAMRIGLRLDHNPSDAELAELLKGRAFIIVTPQA